MRVERWREKDAAPRAKISPVNDYQLLFLSRASLYCVPVARANLETKDGWKASWLADQSPAPLSDWPAGPHPSCNGRFVVPRSVLCVYAPARFRQPRQPRAVTTLSNPPLQPSSYLAHQPATPAVHGGRPLSHSSNYIKI